jgi:hypothetical protein
LFHSEEVQQLHCQAQKDDDDDPRHHDCVSRNEECADPVTREWRKRHRHQLAVPHLVDDASVLEEAGAADHDDCCQCHYFLEKDPKEGGDGGDGAAHDGYCYHCIRESADGDRSTAHGALLVLQQMCYHTVEVERTVAPEHDGEMNGYRIDLVPCSPDDTKEGILLHSKETGDDVEEDGAKQECTRTFYFHILHWEDLAGLLNLGRHEHKKDADPDGLKTRLYCWCKKGGRHGIHVCEPLVVEEEEHRQYRPLEKDLHHQPVAMLLVQMELVSGC